MLLPLLPSLAIAALATCRDLVPNLLPFLPPSVRSVADDADLRW
jgi:hypothetical protein